MLLFLLFWYYLVVLFFRAFVLLDGTAWLGSAHGVVCARRNSKIVRNTKAKMTNIVEQFSIPDGFADILKSLREKCCGISQRISMVMLQNTLQHLLQQAPTSENENLNIDMEGLENESKTCSAQMLRVKDT